MSETTDLTSRDPGVIQEEKITPILMTCATAHRFERVRGTEAKCVNCPLGYYLSPGMDVKKGHLFLHGEQIL